MELKGTVALVTGASSGIGEALAEALVDAGARVALIARREDRLQALANRLGRDRTAVFRGDVGRRADLEVAVAGTLERWRRVDVLVNNAGIGLIGPVETLSQADLEAIWQTNVLGPILAVQAALPALRQSRGMIVNISSVMSIIALPGWAAYGATKAALNVLSATLRNELRADGIRVLNVWPGMTATEFFEASRYTREDATTERWRTSRPPRSAADAAREIVEAIRKDLENWEVPPRDRLQIDPARRVP